MAIEKIVTTWLNKHPKNNLSVNKEGIEDFIEILFKSLFQNTSETTNQKNLTNTIINLQNNLKESLGNLPLDKDKDLIIEAFFSKIPDLYNILIDDANFMLINDPAATCIQEIMLAYPGFFAIAVYRFAHELYLLKVPLIPRILTEYAHSKTGIDIHPAATIDFPFCIDHGTGIVIGESTYIGKKVKIYQGVTLGAISVAKEKANTKRHPTIEDNVVIYSGASILGGKTVIGHNSIIGGNVWLTKSVSANSIVFYKSQLIIEENINNNNILNFVI